MDNIELISQFAERIASLVTPENESIKVPSCPEWSLLDLVLHLGEVHEFWAANARAANVDQPWRGERSNPRGSGDEIAWCRRQTADLVSALNSYSAESPCWTWWAEPRTVGAVERHQVQEAAIHCWDAENAIGTPGPISLDVARDGIAEYLHVHRFGIEDLDIKGIKFQEIDSENVWYINPDRAVESTVTASASDLVLFLHGRLGLKHVKIEGDSGGIEKFCIAAPEINS